MTRDEAWGIVGGLVEPGTIPGLVGYGWNISKDHCRRGRLLRKQPGTVCHECFAATWLYERPSVKEGMERRFQCMNNPRWVEAMVRLIKGEEIFRWFDSGDLQDVAHLERIAAVCDLTPQTRHWMPTKEWDVVREFVAKRSIPANLSIRLSVECLDKALPESPIPGCNLATVTTEEPAEGAYNCPSSFYGAQSCDDAGCRACYDKNIPRVNYKLQRRIPKPDESASETRGDAG